MFRVEVDRLKEYFDFDPERRNDLLSLDKLIYRSAPALKRYFHRGTPAGEPGMRFKMIGYGRFRYTARSGQQVEWPVIGVALQKNYISVYLSVTKDGAPLVEAYTGRLGAWRTAHNNFSFRSFEELNAAALTDLFAEAERIFLSGPGGCRYSRQSEFI